jgi:hypothetical protein
MVLFELTEGVPRGRLAPWFGLEFFEFLIGLPIQLASGD